MLKYDKFFAYLKQMEISQYSLIHRERISAATLHVMRRSSDPDPCRRPGRGLQVKTLDRLCNLLHCRPEDILEQDLEHDDQIRQILLSLEEKKDQPRFSR